MAALLSSLGHLYLVPVMPARNITHGVSNFWKCLVDAIFHMLQNCDRCPRDNQVFTYPYKKSPKGLCLMSVEASLKGPSLPIQRSLMQIIGFQKFYDFRNSLTYKHGIKKK